MELRLLVGMFFVSGGGCKLENIVELQLFVGMVFVEGVGVHEQILWNCGCLCACSL